MHRSLRDFDALTFDCYGTMIDWESGIWDAFQPVLLANARDDVTRQRALALFAEVETAQERETPHLLYPDLLTRVHATMAARLGLDTDAGSDARFGRSVPHWPAFADAADALRRLKRRYRLVILSNVNRDGFAASNRKLGVTFDAVHTAEDIGSYKPAAANFDYLIAHVQGDLGIPAERILHTAQSLHHDHVPASRAGLARAWIDRQGLAEGGDWGATAVVAERPDVDFRFATLADMADAVDRAEA